MAVEPKVDDMRDEIECFNRHSSLVMEAEDEDIHCIEYIGQECLRITISGLRVLEDIERVKVMTKAATRV